MKNKIIPIIIYLIAFSIIFGYGMSHLPINDGVKEYVAYQQNIQEGWKFRLTLVNSCVITTYLPALLWKWFGGDQLFMFRLIPALFYALMPVFTYLIARKYLSVWKSLLAVIMLMLNSYFAFFPDIGRVGVGVAFMAGTIWALLNKKMVWIIVFSILVVFAHYGTAFVLIGVLGIALLINLIKYRKNLKYYVIPLVLVIVLTGIWHFGIAGYSGHVMYQTLFQTEKTGYAPLYGKDGQPIIQALIDPSTREPAVQEALFLNFKEFTAPQLIEVLSNWVIVLLVCFGVYLTLRDKKLDAHFKMLSLASFIMIILTVSITWLSIYYGGMRVYFSTSMLLATCFVFGIDKLSKLLHVPLLILSIIVLTFYGLSTTGLIYNIWGLHKWIPVAIRMEG